MAIFVLGYPSYLGGADTELWHTLRLWRRFGAEVVIIPTWRADPHHAQRLESIGIPTCQISGPDQLERVPGLPGSTVVSFCNAPFLKVADRLKAIHCRLVWVNCMTWHFPGELEHYPLHGPFSAYVFQSRFQQQQLSEVYERYGATSSQFHLIPGAFAAEEFPFAPLRHRSDEPFVMGRLARSDQDKWSSHLWPIYNSVRYQNKRARVMGWSHRLIDKCGSPPPWAETLTANQEPVPQFLGSLHCLFSINGGARENWPRVGLEAMAAGVPIVAERAWGWREMIDHGVNGFLGSDDQEMAHYAAVLAYDEPRRMEMIENARHHLVEHLAEPNRLWARWQQLFQTVAE